MKFSNRSISDTASWYIGVDGGGTKTHAVLVNQDLKLIDEVYSGPANIATDVESAYISICAVIDILLKKHKLPVIQIGIGVAGYSVVQNRNIIQDRLQNKYVQITLHSDCHIACLAAHNNQDGAIIICGTGAVAYSIYKGQPSQIGGWGFPHGDLGGSAYLGLEVARLLCKAIDGLIPWHPALHDLYIDFFQQDSHKYKMWLIEAKPADYAKITHFIFLRPADEFSRKLLESGVAELSELITVLKDGNPELCVKLTGGLAGLYIDKLHEQYPELQLSSAKPTLGAVLSVLMRR